MFSVGVLAELAVDPGLEIQVVRIADLIRGNYERTERAVRIKRFTQGEGLRPHLPVAHATVVAHTIPGDNLVCAFFGHVSATFSDDES